MKRTSTPMSADMLVAQTITQFTNNIDRLHNQKENAISAFRQTANQLEEINKSIDTNVSMMDSMIEFLTNEKVNLTKQSSDNNAVRAKILEIIGA